MGLFMGFRLWLRRALRSFITNTLASRLVAKAEARMARAATQGAPESGYDFLIAPSGAPYLYRWWLVPKNPLLNVYLHKTVADDDNRALHDHPYFNVSVILRGSYFEIMPCRSRGYVGGDAVKTVRREAGDIVFRRAIAPHRLMLPHDMAPCWSLFITGPRLREWGFFCPNGWRDQAEYRDRKTNGSSIGNGCA